MKCVGTIYDVRVPCQDTNTPGKVLILKISGKEEGVNDFTRCSRELKRTRNGGRGKRHVG